MDAPAATAVRSLRTWRQLFDEARAAVGDDARWMLRQALDGPDWAQHLDRPAPPSAERALGQWVGRRLAGEPLQYVLGSWPFRHMELLVDRRVLIPRPETEQVVEVALAELRPPGLGSSLRVADLGTGSGAIALSIAAEAGRSRAAAGAPSGADPGNLLIWAVDESQDALDVASANLAGLGGRRATAVRLARGDWYRGLPPELRGHLNLIVSNPPYLSDADWDAVDPVVQDWEPRPALVAGPSGLEAIERIVASAPRWLSRSGVAVIEIGESQAHSVSVMATVAGFEHVEIRADLAGKPRVLVARLQGRAG